MANLSSPNNPFKDWQFWAMWIVIILILMTGGAQKCHAKDNDRVDTVLCKPECIIKIIEKPTAKTIKYTALYRDSSINLEELISMSKSVKEYISECKIHGITPLLGIKLKNSEIQSIIRLRKKWRVH